MAQEFKLGRLRYNWAGTWAPATVYSRDDIVLNDGKAYSCLIPGTSSANFYTDLYATFPVWSLITDGKTWVGPWASSYSYGVGHIVVFGGKVYYSSTAHTSTTFLADAANWTVYTEFDGWKPTWTPNTAYGPNDVVKYGGIVYKCTANHLSAGSTSAGLEANQASWTVYYSGVEYKGAYTSGTRYKLNDLVKVDGNIYICTGYHTASSTVDVTKFSMWLPGQMFDLVWSAGTTYQVGDTVVYGGDAYISKTANNSNNFPDTDVVNWGLFNVGYTVRNTWTSGASYAPGDLVARNGVLYEAIARSTAQDPNTSTVTNLYIAAGSSGSAINLFSTNGIVPGMIASGTGITSGQVVSTIAKSTASATTSTISGASITVSSYTSTTGTGPYLVTFAIPTQSSAPTIGVQYTVAGNSNALYNGSYVCTSSTTTSITLSYFANPGTYGSGTTTVKSVIGNVLKLNGTVTGTFAPGMILTGTGVSSSYIVSGSGTSWIVSSSQSVASTTITGTLNTVTLSSPPTGSLVANQSIYFLGTNSTYWSVLIPGKKWSKRWTVETQYAVGDIVSWANGTYVCVNNHTSAYSSPSSNNRPDYDISASNWILLIANDLNNTLNVQGDLRTFKNAKPVALPITATDENNNTIDINTYVLGVSTDLPNWKKINVIPAVYYVDTFNGVDSLTYGRTWDQPWKTISYACNVINQGFYYPNAVELLKANKAFMVAEMYQWMLYQMSQSNSPFSPDSLWDVNYTQRDADRIIDAIIYDMKRGGNSQTVAATLSYFFVGTQDQFINSLTAASAVYYSPALTFLLSVMQAVVRNTALDSFQVLNAVPASSVVNQVIKNTLTAESGTTTAISSLMNIVTTALTNQNTYQVPGPNTGITASIYVKTGTYNEPLPIVIPENVAIIGDELRSAVVQPAISKTLYCTQTTEPSSNPLTSNLMIVNSTIGLTDQMPLQFISPYVNNAPTTFGGVVSGKTYYVIGSSITSTTLQLNDGPTFTFTGSTTIGSNVLSNVTSITNLAIGMSITGPGIPTNTVVAAFSQAVNTIATVTLGILTYDNGLGIYYYAPSNATSSGVLQTFTASGNPVQFTNGVGNMTVYAGDCLKNMFLMRNGTTIRNMSLFGLKGTVGPNNEYDTARPTGGAYTSLDPGTGPNDTSVWIIRKSPYAQNLTVFGDGATGIKIDGYLHNGGSKSIVSNDYTMVISDGIGIWCTGPGAITEAISVFSYYAYAGYFAEAGGRIRSANGNSSYGTFGVVSEGYDLTEVPVTGTVNNQSQQVQAGVVSAFGTTDQLLKLNYSNAGSAYYLPTTNMLKYSNEFLTTWTNDANVSFIKNSIAPSGYTEAWLLTGSTGTPGTGYIQQSVAINPGGYIYTDISGTTQDGAPGNGATFDITVTPSGYLVSVHTGTAGTLYQVGNNILIKGSVLGGLDSINDLTIVVGTLAGTGISTISAISGTVPAGTSQTYTLSMYVYAGTSASIDLQATFSGGASVTSGINYNVSSHTVTPYSGTSLTSSANGGTLPVNYGAQKTLVNGWYRVWMAINDATGVNTSLTYKFFPQGANAPIANTYSIIYGSQLEISGASPSPDFYLETTTNRFSAYANFEVVGAGAGAILSGEENRSQAVFNARIKTDNNGFTGGSGYATSSNTAQDGNANTIKLSATDIGLYNYLGMRVFINSGTGAGQYGFISYYNNSSSTDSNGIAAKTALVLKDSVDTLNVVSSTYNATAALNLLTLSSGTDISTWYVNQPVQFIPTYYTTTATATSVDTVVATATVGGVVNTINIPTESLAVNMPVTFGTGDFNITAGFQYYITTIDYVNNLIQLSTELSGNPIQLSTVASGSQTMTYPRYSGYIKAPTANMIPNINIQFTGVALGGLALGTNYYINDIIDANRFTVSTLKVTLTSTSSIAGTTNTINASNAQASLVPMNPIVFSGIIFDAAISPGVTYYVSNIVDASNFNITTSIIRTTATKTTFGTNLITMATVTDFVVGQPIIFSGIAAGSTFGNIASETVYYIQTINTLTKEITISADKTNTFILTNKSGLILARTCPAPISLGAGTGSMTLTSTGTRVVVTNSVGNISTMNGTFSTSLFGGLNSYTVYYITALTAGDTPTLSISTSIAGTPITLSTGVGNMQMAASGWDNITPGTPASVFLDSTSAYFIEPRVSFTSPANSQTNGTISTPLTGGASFNKIAYGYNYFVAIPTTGSVGASSSDGLTWTPIVLPATVGTWSDIAYGNFYWAALGKTTVGNNSVVAYSNSNGQGWRTSALPTNSNWSSIVYGNGTFVAISSDNTRASYSTNQAEYWAATNLPSSTPVVLTGTPVISTAQQKFGISSLSLNGSSYVTVASDARFAYNNEDFTIEFFWRPTALGTQQILIDQRSTSNEAAIYLEMNTSGNIRLFVLGSYRITSSNACSAGAWNHVAVSRASGTTRLFLNGTLTATTYTDANVYAARPLRIGASFTGGSPATGYFDEIRVSRGVSRYTTTFTPALTAFTTDANTMLLMHLDDANGSTNISSITGAWTSLAYGAGLFVAINTNGQTAWSPDGITWNLSTAPTSNTTLSGVTIIGGGGQFTCTTSTTTQLIIGQSIVVSGNNTGDGTITNGTYYISATNGKSTFTLADSYSHAIAGTNPISTGAGTTTGLTFAVGAPSYTGVAFGNNKFVAIQSGTGLRSAYSFDGANWYQSLTYMSADRFEYGQGVFVAVNSGSTTAYISEHGLYWKARTLTYGSISAIKFGFTSANVGVFATLTGTGGSSGNATAIGEGAKSQGRITVNSGVISALSLWEPGSGYTAPPTVALIDYNVSVTATLEARIGNGTLGNPTFINRGTGYSTTSTVVTITGSGFADTYQKGLNLIVKNLNTVPLVGSNLSIAGNDQVYKITSATAVFGTTAPFIEATIQISPEMTATLSPDNGTAIQLRQLYSQCRVTNHDFLLVGTGNRATANYPYTDITTAKINQQAVETNQGHIFYSSTDENGNFSVGGLFGVQQATGTVTLSATQFGLTGLQTLSLGGIAVGSSGVVVTQFSTDNTFAANSDAIVPTQRAVKSYLTGRLSQGGANTYTGNFIAGTVSVGGPNVIKSTVANGAVGSSIKMANKVYITGKGVDGGMAALDMFMRSATRRGL
jgi:hypothetical protein